jgi:hypothetical protein
MLRLSRIGMLSKELLSLIGIWALLAFLILLYIQNEESARYFLVRKAIAIKEPFAVEKVTVPIFTGTPEPAHGYSPAAADLEKSRAPYHLLKGVLPDAAEDKPSGLTAKACYEGDYHNRLQKTGDYTQVTNNYRHADPDSCSAGITDLVTSFYKNPGL